MVDVDRNVRSGAMHHGTDYPCTGHAHFNGEHFRCCSPAHPDGLPSGLWEALRDQSIVLPGDAEVQRLIGEHAARTAGQ